MEGKFLMCGIIFGLFVAAIYSSSARVFAAEVAPTMSCSYTKDKKTAFCSDNDPDNNDVWRCDKQKNGTWKCGKVAAATGGSISPDLSKALSIATESAVNITNAPNDFVSKKDSLLNNNNQITSNEADSPTPPPCPDKGPIPPDCTMKPIIK
jgi:hypothetical protein